MFISQRNLGFICLRIHFRRYVFEIKNTEFFFSEITCQIIVYIPHTTNLRFLATSNTEIT